MIEAVVVTEFHPIVTEVHPAVTDVAIKTGRPGAWVVAPIKRAAARRMGNLVFQ